MSVITQRRQSDALIIRENKPVMQKPVRICMHDGICQRKAVSRGHCRSHVQALYRLVRESEGRITLEQLERAGRCLPLRRPAKAFFLEGIAS